MPTSEPTKLAIQSASALLESLKEINKTENCVANHLIVPEVKSIAGLESKLVSLLEGMQG